MNRFNVLLPVSTASAMRSNVCTCHTSCHSTLRSRDRSRLGYSRIELGRCNRRELDEESPRLLRPGSHRCRLRRSRPSDRRYVHRRGRRNEVRSITRFHSSPQIQRQIPVEHRTQGRPREAPPSRSVACRVCSGFPDVKRDLAKRRSSV
jgi:hypothetical protein